MPNAITKGPLIIEWPFIWLYGRERLSSNYVRGSGRADEPRRPPRCPERVARGMRTAYDMSGRWEVRTPDTGVPLDKVRYYGVTIRCLTNSANRPRFLTDSASHLGGWPFLFCYTYQRKIPNLIFRRIFLCDTAY